MRRRPMFPDVSARPPSFDQVSQTKSVSRAGCPVASKSSDVRPKITLACVDCKERNYITKKNRRNNPDRLEMKKFCPRDKKHTLHRETR